MNILVIESSPHKHGSSNLLADHFIKGAREAGHQVDVFDAGHSKINPCQGCDYCGMAGPCIQKDDMETLKQKILDSDMVVFVTPLYYFGLSSQMKKVIDRFYSFNSELASRNMKTALIAAAWDERDWTMDALLTHYQTLCRYLNFDNQGEILGTGCGTPSMTQNSIFPEKAYEFGRSL